MKIVFVSNYFNHHQKPFSDAMYAQEGIDYYFIATEPMDDERIAMGWDSSTSSEYVIRSYQSFSLYKMSEDLINEADVVLYGSAPISLLKKRLRKRKLTIRVSERLFKTKISNPIIFILKIIKYYWKYGHYKNQYLLCCSGFASLDYKRTGNFINKAYKWAYFPETRKFDDFEEILGLKHPASILWAGRLIGLKHPEMAIEVAKKLRKQKINFSLTIIGDGPLREELNHRVIEDELESYVKIIGAVPADEVRSYMERSELFLFTSDRNEGWGAVLNESMNSGCAVIASHAIGAVPFLIEDAENGFVFRSGDVEGLFDKVLFLISNPEERKRLGRAAYETIINEWNAETAALRLIELVKSLINGNVSPFLFENGPCSLAELVSDDWF